ncbi:hypothetical protein E0765_08525 [Sulfuricurvum sp. IAE1]|uniref:hypothetical protein n=1 Tax=Sulfuricurvum sp. IAE1 TaxID=2546102 RepID=UPI00104E07DF|nr:hypothetical protein [Sulfuricurvum sp. IAE1]TDA63238.1 hypothetical protein E0765_08525 [Sulfuricurvum sp. IAE1]
MRGSIDWQTAELVKVIFVEGAKKEERVDPSHPHYQCVASYKAMETYRSVWKNFGHYLKEQCQIKDFEQITGEYIEVYMLYKIEYYPSKSYLQKLSASLGKLEIALKRYTLQKYGEARHYDFKVRQIQLNLARNLDRVYDGYHSRVYKDPKKLIDSLSDPKHRLCALMQLFGITRFEGASMIRAEQMHGYKVDPITHKEVGVIETKEKGGKIGDVYVDTDTYRQIEEIIEKEGKFKISYKSYADDIRNTCTKLKIECHGSHGFRWTAAQRRVREYQRAGYSYEESLQAVSWEMKHFRSSITEHYLC